MNVSVGRYRSLDRRPVVRLLHLSHRSPEQSQQAGDPRATPLAIGDRLYSTPMPMSRLCTGDAALMARRQYRRGIRLDGRFLNWT